MTDIKVVFEYRTGVRHHIFRNVRLMGSWTPDGRYSDHWRTVLMKPFKTEDDCPSFRAEVNLAEDQVGRTFSWGVMLDVQGQPNIWGIMTEDGPLEEAGLHRSFVLEAQGQLECYWLTHCRRLGANKCFRSDSGPGLEFSVWAPNAQKVETVIAEAEAGGYIWNDGRGIREAFPMSKDGEGIWKTEPGQAELADFRAWPNTPYMYRITREDGSVAYRSDIFSRAQMGTGSHNPEEGDWNGRSDDLDATKSCSVVLDPDSIGTLHIGPEAKGADSLDEADFWAHEFNPLRPLPSRVEDLVIYEMHVGGLGCGHPEPGNLLDAMGMLDYLVDLGINAIELMPMSEFDGAAGWGYGTSHFFAIKYDRGGRDQFKHFVKACHQHGIAVIMDVVYNHYTPDSERAEWMYDSLRNDHNIYYYYHGSESDYPEDFPEGGYADNYSTGYLPDMTSEMVRKMLISSAVAMAMEFHIDGFRMDLTQALHSFNVIHFDGRPAVEANEAGIRFMREWVRTLKLFKPFAILLAEDHSGWPAMSQPQTIGGLGFDSIWWSEWYHQLIGDAKEDKSMARLIHEAGLGGDWPLKMDLFGQVMGGSPGRVVYHASHDEVGNSAGTARTIELAVGGQLNEENRPWAEARCRVAAGLTILSPGIPMFFMGEEVGAREPYRYDDFLEHREDFEALRSGSGANLFRYYQDLIRLRRWSPAFISPSIEVILTHDDDRLLAFLRSWGQEEFLVAVSLNNRPFDQGRLISHPGLTGKTWTEVLNSDADIYGGSGLCNCQELKSLDGNLNLVVPANGLTVLAKCG